MTDSLRPITLSLAALGGQGGGVVADWLVSAARRSGHLAQATSVPGVAQRTGATIYYLEFFPESAMRVDGREPVMALMPHPGNVDVVVAFELMEAGRAMQRGIVTPDRTTLIASSHREYTISEKEHRADGRANSDVVLEQARNRARRFICYDMAALADKHGAMISAPVFGAIAGSGVLPFERAAFRQAISASGIAVDRNLAAFDASADRAASRVPFPRAHSATKRSHQFVGREMAGLAERVRAQFPLALHPVLEAAIDRLADYQDAAYAREYLDRVAIVLRADRGADGLYALTEAFARGLALWMSFEDAIRVADLKIRADRMRRVRSEVGAADNQIVYVTEFMKPRVEEICGTLPHRLGRWLRESRMPKAILQRFTTGKQICTSHVAGFSFLRAIAGLRRWRRGTLRFQEEMAHIAEWSAVVLDLAARDLKLAEVVARSQRLVKGYGETHERGFQQYMTILSSARRLAGTPDASARVDRLLDAAVADLDGKTLLQTAEQDST